MSEEKTLELNVILPDGTELTGDNPVVILGPNGSGKTRLSRRLVERTTNVPLEFINALRNTRISAQLPAMSKLQALQQHDSGRQSARSQPWEITSDFDVVLSQLLADDGDSAREFRQAIKGGGSVDSIPPTALEITQQLWQRVFPGRGLEWKDWTPVVNNDRAEVATYGANQMSDGERAALYLQAKVLLAQPGTILVIDEPETHFHSELAVHLWDALEETRPDLRFVYVTHDLLFALSREPADFLLADPVVGLTVMELDSSVPAEIRRDILGAASFSYYASRVVFCEGEAHSYDKSLLSAWFNGRDTVVKAVGSGTAVRQCVDVLKSSQLVSNLEAIGVVDRDHRFAAELEALAEEVTVLPVHEIEGIVCMPSIATALAAHLAAKLEDGAIEKIVRESVGDDDVRRVAFERTKLTLRNIVEDRVSSKPSVWDQDGIEGHYRNVEAELARSLSAEAIFKSELKLAREAHESGDVAKILEIFPSKRIAKKVADALGVNVSTLFDLISGALEARDSDDSLHRLGTKLERALTEAGLPSRATGERPITAQQPAAGV